MPVPHLAAGKETPAWCDYCQPAVGREAPTSIGDRIRDATWTVQMSFT
jgi:hypothetical protein